MENMGDKLQRTTLICPCCGHERAIAATGCNECGARQVGPPLAKPDVILPNLGPSLMALACALLVLLVFVAAWIFSNDSKVGRVLLVSVLGDGTKLTRSLLAADPKLPLYRIFTYDASRLAFLLSAILIPLSMVGMWLARRARRLTAAEPAIFGGARIARTSLLLSSAWFILLLSVTAFNIPDALARGKAKRQAATRAAMYKLHREAIQKYFNEFGRYPEELSDLSRLNINVDGKSQLDYWEQPFLYRPDVEMASKGSKVSFTNYRLVSAGADGKYGTADDLIMVDGSIIDTPAEDDLPVSVAGSGAAGEK